MKYLNIAQRVNNGKEIVYLLTDFSPSMDESDYAPTRKVGAVEANKHLIRKKAELHSQDMVGLIAFDAKAQVLHPHVQVGKHCQAICNSFNQDTKEWFGTNFTAALKLAEEQFRKPLIEPKPKKESLFWKSAKEFFWAPAPSNPSSKIRQNDGITKRIILLTDGEHNRPSSPVKVANRLKENGVIIECIGIAGNRKDVDEKMLKQIASLDENGNPMYCFIGDTDDLIRKYEKMSHHIRPV